MTESEAYRYSAGWLAKHAMRYDVAMFLASTINHLLARIDK